MSNPYVTWIDQAEWYIVCYNCRETNRENEWSGSTQVRNWNAHKKAVYEQASLTEHCEFCKRPFDWFVNVQNAMFWLFNEAPEWGPTIRGPFPDEVFGDKPE